MPIYEYRCADCQKVFEEWTRHIDDNVEQICPECGGKSHRIVSNTSFVLKGGGWYATEYGNRRDSSHDTSAGAHTSSPAAASTEAQASSPAGSAGSSDGKTKDSPSAGASSGTAAAPAPSSGAPAAAAGSAG